MEEDVEKTKKKSFWKDKKNWLIIFLLFMVFACAGSSDTENVSANAVSINTVSGVSGDELNQVKNELNTANSKLEDAENTIKYLSGELENTSISKKEYENRIQNLSASNEELLEKIENLTIIQSNLQKEIDNLNNEKTDLEEKNEELEAENGKLKTSASKSSSTKTTSTTSTATIKAATPTQSSNSYTVYITKTGSKYHRDGCSYLKSKITIDKNSAISSGYGACSRCNP